MIPLPPRSTRTDTLFPYTTLFLSTIAVTRFTADRKEFRVQSPKPMSCRPWLAAILVAVSGLAYAQEPQADAPAPAVAAPDVVFVPPRDPPLPLLWQASDADNTVRSEEHTSELPSLMRISYAASCLKKQ